MTAANVLSALIVFSGVLVQVQNDLKLQNLDFGIR